MSSSKKKHQGNDKKINMTEKELEKTDNTVDEIKSTKDVIEESSKTESTTEAVVSGIVDNSDKAEETVKQKAVSETVENKEEKNDKAENEKSTEQEKNLFENIKNDIKNISSSNTRELILASAKILLPVIALAIIIATVFTLVKTKNSNDNAVEATGANDIKMSNTTSTIDEEPLQENAYKNVNELFEKFYIALADGDIDTIKQLKDYNDETELITYEKRSEFIEAYDNINCYTKNGLEENSYFVYVSYEAKIKGIDTKAPGLYPWYVYTSEDGSLLIDGNMDEQITATLKLVTNQDDVVDLYNKVDVKYKDAIASDEKLNEFLVELPTQIKVSVGEALAMLETQDNVVATEEGAQQESEEKATDEDANKPQNQVVNERVKATDTVNVRSSDSEEADKIGKAQVGTEMSRTEIKVNGWSKVIFEGKEAYIKSDYLEVISSEEAEVTDEDANNTDNAGVTKTSGKVMATTNVNVRNAAKQTADAIGVAQGGTEYTLIENLGEWLKIDYNGHEGYVKSEFFR